MAVQQQKRAPQDGAFFALASDMRGKRQGLTPVPQLDR